jgi:prolyl-tRNA editing enzyme YbaK/EbsC (Cys-tRNA(Pro) deacylase)
MPAEEALDEVDERVLDHMKKYDFVKYAWSSEEAAAELGVEVDRIYQSISKIQKLKKREVYVYYKDGAVHIQTD